MVIHPPTLQTMAIWNGDLQGKYESSIKAEPRETREFETGIGFIT